MERASGARGMSPRPADRPHPQAADPRRRGRGDHRARPRRDPDRRRRRAGRDQRRRPSSTGSRPRASCSTRRSIADEDALRDALDERLAELERRGERLRAADRGDRRRRRLSLWIELWTPGAARRGRGAGARGGSTIAGGRSHRGDRRRAGCRRVRAVGDPDARHCRLARCSTASRCRRRSATPVVTEVDDGVDPARRSRSRLERPTLGPTRELDGRRRHEHASIRASAAASCCAAGAGGALGLYGLGALAGCTVERQIDKPEGGVSSSRRSTATC